MKKGIALVILFLTLISCGKSNEQKATDLLGTWMNSHLHDFSSYESIELKLDSAYHNALTDTAIMNQVQQFLIIKDEYELKADEARGVLAKMKELAEKGYSPYNRSQLQWNYERLDESSTECMAYVLIGIEKDDAIRDMITRMDTSYIGWYVDHTFRSKNPLGNNIIQHYRFLVDPGFTEILKYWDLDDNYWQRIFTLFNSYFNQEETRFFYGDAMEFVSNDIALGKRGW